MNIRKATQQDIERVMEIYAIALKYMHQNGNPTQWQGGYPSRDIVMKDIELGRLFLAEDANGAIVAQFCFFVGNDPTYDYIDGAWLNDEPYGVIHRLASSGEMKGVGKLSIEWCLAQHNNIRIDTHTDNISMQKIIRANGFTECGEIIVANGTRRIAFHRTL